ncbi:hypothetical protein AUJ68_02475 [Candidatus Woesearchaeota archaeon CG1_02_57_44]|nr:MAG: hypothetical protein AUJ68_02475 [Candidatus Woesearchaeota archaeon CG1_02_57_44]
MENLLTSPDDQRCMGKKVLIASLYSADPVILAVTRLGAERLILLVDDDANKEQEKSLKLIQDSLGRVIDVKTVKVGTYDVLGTARKVAEVIMMQPSEDWIYVNVTGGRKTKALGLLYGAYARAERVRKIAYNADDKKTVVYLPKMGYNLKDSEKTVLDAVASGRYTTLAALAEGVDISRAMLYRNVKELEANGYLDMTDGIRLTMAGELVRV